MEFDEAVKRRVPLQVCLPNPRRPLTTSVRAVAEVFLVETKQGSAVVWLDPFWCAAPPDEACHIAYAMPRRDQKSERWLDNDPRYGPKCLVYQKPFLMERLTRASSAWVEHKAWRAWLEERAVRCGRKAAWTRVGLALGDLIVARRV